MKTTAYVIEHSGIDPSLVRSVVRQLGGKESLPDIVNHGIDGGFSGFIYTAETVAFFKRNRAAIVELVERTAEASGEEPLSLVAGFRCLQPADAQTRKAIAQCLYGGRIPSGIGEEVHTVATALAWFAGEEVARAFCDE